MGGQCSNHLGLVVAHTISCKISIFMTFTRSATNGGSRHMGNVGGEKMFRFGQCLPLGPQWGGGGGGGGGGSLLQ